MVEKPHLELVRMHFHHRPLRGPGDCHHVLLIALPRPATRLTFEGLQRWIPQDEAIDQGVLPEGHAAQVVRLESRKTRSFRTQSGRQELVVRLLVRLPQGLATDEFVEVGDAPQGGDGRRAPRRACEADAAASHDATGAGGDALVDASRMATQGHHDAGRELGLEAQR